MLFRSSIDDSSKDVDQRLYRSMISSLIYLIASRPNVMQAVEKVARFQEAPGRMKEEGTMKGTVGFLPRRVQICSVPLGNHLFPCMRDPLVPVSLSPRRSVR